MKKLLSVLLLTFISTSIYAQIGFNEILLDDTMYASIVTADMDGDGDLDILARGLNWYENLDGQGNFGDANVIAANNSENFFAADMDGDGDMDVCITNGYSIIWLENTDGVGGDFISHLVPVDMYLENIEQISVTDFDGDGDIDIMYRSESYDYGDTVGWLRNDGTGNFDTKNTLNINNNLSKTVYFIDANGDGDMDVIMDIFWTDINIDIFILENVGDGNTQLHSLIDFEAHSHSRLYAIDIDGDGDNDIVHNRSGEGLIWFENDNEVYQAPELFFESASGFSSINTGDIDSDGDLDFISNVTGGLKWREKLDGLGEYGEEFSLANLPISFNQIYLADFNGDAMIDFFREQYIYLNVGPIGNQISGNVRLDLESDGCDETDVPMANILVTTDNGSNAFSTFTDNNGFYSFLTNPGIFNTTIENPSTDVYAVSPDFYTSDFPDLNGSDIADFCLDILQEINDVNIVIYTTNDAQPGFEATYRIYYRNVGNTSLNGEISLSYNEEKLNILTASEPVSSQSSGNLTFNYSNFLPFQSAYIDVMFLVEPPPITEIDDVLTFTAEITPIVGDATEDDNTYTKEQVVVGSFDPNDIIVLEGEEIYLAEADDYLHYMIRFQNEGTAPATFIRVTNQLDEDLDWNTLQIESISHDYSVEIIDGNDITFFFDAIYLPDSTTDEEGSHGFITYKIKPKNPAALGDVFTNSANIFFDYNPPVATNTVTTTIVENLSVSDNKLNNLKLFPNPTNGLLNIQSNTEIVSVEVLNQLGQLVVSLTNSEGINSINIQQLQQGMYFIKLKEIQGNSIVKKLIKE